jgi:hypothetical protein
VRFAGCVLVVLASALCCGAQQVAEHVPAMMRGKWVVTKQLTGQSLGCFDPEHARGLVGLKFSFSESVLHWGGHASKDLDPHARRVSVYEFQARYGQKPGDLGIVQDPVPIVQVTPSYGIPVNILVLRDSGTMLIDACNIWLEARRDGAGSE